MDELERRVTEFNALPMPAEDRGERWTISQLVNDLFDEIERLRAENVRLRSEAEYWRITAAHRGQQIPDAAPAPVAWMRADGSEGSVTTMTVCISDKVRDLWLKANPKQVERYTIPLYIRAAKGER